ncbi:MAG: SBBP repeat-containing protein [Acidobacteriota bacterium]
MAQPQPTSGIPPASAPALASSPVFFIANKGQFEPDAEFHAFSQRMKAWLEPERIVLAQDDDVVEMMFPGARRAPRIEGMQPLATRVNYLRGAGQQSVQDVPAFAAVAYRELYEGVDMIFAAEAGNLKTEFIVQPGTDHRVIRIRYRGAQSVEVEEEGGLVVHTSKGSFREHAPIAYQDLPEGRRYLGASYFMQGDETAGYLIEEYNHQVPLVIDPVLTYSTYIGGTRSDAGNSIALDSAGSIYVAGYTDSTNIPTQSSIQNQGGSMDAFVFKLNAAGTQIVFATFIGGAGDDRAYGVAVDAAGSAYACGVTASADFPKFNSAQIQAARGGARDGFVLKLNPAGNALVYSSYIGGSGNDAIYGCVLDSYNQLYAVGETNSTDLPTKAPFRATNAGGYDGMLLKINFNSALVFNTYFGGAADDSGRAIALHATQLTPYVTGYTWSTNFPVLNPAQPTNAGGQDAFVMRFNSDGNALVFSTYLGGSGGTTILPEQGLAIAVDPFGNNYVAGVTSSTNFPVASAYQSTNKGGLDAFFTKHDNGGIRVYSSYLGGSGTDVATSLVVDVNRQIFVAGYTSSVNFPTVLPSQAILGGSYDAFMTQVNVNGAPLIYSSYLGGTAADQAYGVAINLLGEMFLTGTTSSSNFPTQSAYRYTQAGSLDMFVAKLSAAAVPPSAPVFFSLTPNAGSGTSALFSIKYTDANGANNFDSIQFMVNTVLTGVNSCHIAYNHTLGLVYLLNNAGNAWSGGYPPGALNTLSNSQCKLSLTNFSVVAVGSELTLNIPLSFVPTTYTGKKNILALAIDKGGLRSDWNVRGSFTLP